MSGRAVRVALGLLMVATGALWAAQGAGWVGWPAASPMLGRPGWVWGGLLMAAAGAALALAGRRR